MWSRVILDQLEKGYKSSGLSIIPTYTTPTLDIVYGPNMMKVVLSQS